jgi:5-methylcytosine-specific restriction endonuclease McrA
VSPWARKPPCSVPTCPNSKPCPVHHVERKWAPDKRPSASQRGYGPEWTKTRMHVLYRDGECCFCHEAVIEHGRPVKGATVHHIIPRDDGGPDTEDNLLACHKPCHETHHGRRR